MTIKKERRIYEAIRKHATGDGVVRWNGCLGDERACSMGYSVRGARAYDSKRTL